MKQIQNATDNKEKEVFIEKVWCKSILQRPEIIALINIGYSYKFKPAYINCQDEESCRYYVSRDGSFFYITW